MILNTINVYPSDLSEKWQFGENWTIPTSCPCTALFIWRAGCTQYVTHRCTVADTNYILQVSPWMENGNIVQYVKKIPSTDRLKLISDIASGKWFSPWRSEDAEDCLGLEYLHCRGIVHGDLRGVSSFRLRLMIRG